MNEDFWGRHVRLHMWIKKATLASYSMVEVALFFNFVGDNCT